MTSERLVHRRPHRAARAAGVLVAALLTAISAATFAADPSAADKETARALMDQGDKAFDAKDFNAALKAYKAADAIMSLPTTGIWVAKAEIALGQLVEARDTALSVTRLPKRAAERAPTVAARQEADKLADALAKRIPSIQITVTGAPATTGVELRIDDNLVPPAAADQPRKVNPGAHRVTATAPGFEAASKDVTVKEGDATVVPIALARAAAAPSTPPPAAPTRDADQHARGGGISPLVFIGFGVGAVGVGVGAVAGIVAFSKAHDADAFCNDSTCKPDAQDALDSSNTAANISNVAFGVGIAGIGLGIVGLVLSSQAHASPPQTGALARLHVTPVVAPNGAGFRGVFR